MEILQSKLKWNRFKTQIFVKKGRVLEKEFLLLNI